MIDLVELTDNYTFRLTNLLFLVVVLGIVIAYYKYVLKKIKKNFEETSLVIKGNKFNPVKLINQLVLMVFGLLLYGAFVSGNPDFALSNFFNYELISPKLNAKGEAYGLRISIGQVLGAVLVIFIARIFTNVIRFLLSNFFKDKHWIDDARQFTIIQLCRYFIYTVALVIIMKIFIENISGFLLGASALFVGLGLGLQEFFTDIVSGFILLNDGSIKVGDIIEIKEEVSRVEKINLRTSHIRTTEGKIIIVPNSKLTEENVTNWSISDKITRFHINVGVAYGSDTAKVKELLYQAALNHKLVEKSKPITIMFSKFGDSSLDFQLYFWARQTWEILVIKSDIRFEVDRLFRENNIKIPFPQRELHINNQSQGL